MKLEDIKVGMKVRLLGKHGLVDNYDNIEDWYKDYNKLEDVQQIKKQGYGVVIFIEDDGEIKMSDKESKKYIDCWSFIPSDLEPYNKKFFEEPQENKSPKEWLLTPKAIFVVRDSDEEYIVLGNNSAIGVNSGFVWDNDLENDYTDDLIWRDNFSANDIIQITYNGEVVWERKEYMTLTDAIKTGKKIKHKDWHNKYYTISELLRLIRLKRNSDLINDFTVAEWEVEK